MNKNKFYLGLICALQLSFFNCGGGGGSSSTDNKDLFLKLPTEEVNFNITDTVDYDYAYQLLIYVQNEDSSETLIYGPEDIPLYNIDENIYQIKENLSSGNYVLEVRYNRIDKISNTVSEEENIEDIDQEILIEEEEEQSLTLRLIRHEFEFNEDNRTIDLSESDWNFDLDEDSDGLNNFQEALANTDPYIEDTDEDSVNDGDDKFPLDPSESEDMDEDGIGNNTDLDIDGDGLLNSIEEEVGSNPLNPDSDGDGHLDSQDNCILISNIDQNDLDEDEIGNACDDDIDGDTISNTDETNRGSNPESKDTDEDGVNDNLDVFPTDGNESVDFDGDGTGDNSDLDDDNDGLSDIEEANLGSDTFKSDTDEDGVLDGDDNCLLVANQNQSDNDNDGIGDACDPDDDNDGLSDVEENTIGNDGFITLAFNIDSDGDGHLDSQDNCPNDSNENQFDADGDSIGDACDCQPQNPEVNQLAEDSPDIKYQDTNCDGIDGNKYQSVFVSENGVDEVSLGNIQNPTSNLALAIELATENNADLLFSEGIYQASLFDWTSSLKIYGGFSENFEIRDFENHISTIIQEESNDNHSVFDIRDLEDPIVIQGFTIKNQTNDPDSTSLYLSNTHGMIQSNQFISNDQIDIDREIVLKVIDSEIDILNNYIHSGAISEATGIFLKDSSGSINNNLINTGHGSHTKGIVSENSNYKIINNTIDGGRHLNGSAFGITFTDGDLKIINNLILTSNQRSQGSINCDGVGDLENPPLIENNLFIRLTIGDFEFPVYSGCDGNILITNDDLTSSNEISADNNIIVENGELNTQQELDDYLLQFIDVNNFYQLVENSSAIQAGLNLFNNQNYQLRIDYYGSDRLDQDFDIGAVNFTN